MAANLKELVVEALVSHRGEADLGDIYRYMERSGKLDRDQLRETKWGGRPAYQHSVGYIVSGMTKTGSLSRVGSERSGRYRLV